MNNIPFQKLALATALSLLCTVPLTAQALGFGPLRLKSGIGQPLLAEVDVAVQAKEGDDLDIQGATPAEYERQGLVPHPAMSTLTVVVERRAGKLVAVMRTKTPITEPYSQIILEGKLGSSRVSRSYVALLKPTALKEPAAALASARFNDSSAGRPGAPALVGAAIDKAEAVEKPARLARERAEMMQARIPKNWNEKSGAYQDEATRRYASIIEVGSRPVAEELYRVKGYGKQQSVGKVLSQVVPPGWHGYAGQVNVSDLKPVDWTGGNSYWLLLLDEILTERDLTATVDWSKKEVTFRSASGVPGAKVLKAATPAPAAAAPVVAAAPASPAAVPMPPLNPMSGGSMAKAPAASVAPVAPAVVAQAPAALPPANPMSASQMVIKPTAPVAPPAVAPIAPIAPKAPSEAVMAQAKADAAAAAAAADRSKRIAEAQAQAQAQAASQAATAQASMAAAKDAKSVKLTRVSVSSRKGAPAAQVRSSGYNVTLIDAIRQIAPSGWAVFSEDVSAVSAEDVSWKGSSRDWLVVMDEILAQRNLKANVDTDRREVALVRAK